MKTQFKIGKYDKTETGFIFKGYSTFTITYFHTDKIHRFGIAVNGRKTNQSINILNHYEGYKNKILSAIREYKIDPNRLKGCSKGISLSKVKQFYSPQIVNNVINYVLPIKKEVSRDVLYEYGLLLVK